MYKRLATSWTWYCVMIGAGGNLESNKMDA
jgi:hypothetical protein